MNSLLYIHDPLCGWCYAAAPAIARLRQAGIAVELQPSGLFSVPGRTMTADFAAHAWQNDRRIEALTGQIFSEAYRQNVLAAVGTPFDSSVATLALTAVAMKEPAREGEALKALQEGRYVFGQDITDVATVSAILVEAGFPKAAAAFEARSPELTSANSNRVAAGRKSMRQSDSSGVPALLIVEGGIRHLLDSKWLYGSSDALLARVGILSRVESQSEAQ